jgi:hypothetical protein
VTIYIHEIVLLKVAAKTDMASSGEIPSQEVISSTLKTQSLHLK